MQRSISAPLKGESVRMISPAGGWSSCTLLMWLCADREVNEIVISTLRVGKKEMDELCKLNFAKCFVILSGIAKENGKYDYQIYFEQAAAKRGIKYKYVNNHSKVILVKSGGDFYVVETSSNFNENPKIEQFVVSNNEEIYRYYVKVYKKMGLLDGE